MTKFTLYKTTATKTVKVGFWAPKEVFCVKYKFKNLDLMDCNMTLDIFKSICKKFGFGPEKTQYVAMTSFGAYYDVPYEHQEIWVSEEEIEVIPKLCKALSEEEERLIKQHEDYLVDCDRIREDRKKLAEQKGFKDAYCGGN